MNENDPVNLLDEFKRMIQGEPVFIDEHWQASYFLPADFVGFVGHFPDYPLLPALMQIFLAQNMLFLILKQWPEVLEVPLAKFTEQAKPEDTIHICARPLPVVSEAKLTWEFTIKKDAVANEVLGAISGAISGAEMNGPREQAEQIPVSSFRLTFELK